MKTVKITKMQGCGNDFVLVDYDEYKKSNLPMDMFAMKVCNRNFGIGADGVIIPKTDVNEADIGWYFYQSDGSTAQMCGNGMRCFAKYVYDKGLVYSKSFTVKTGAGIITPQILEDETVRVNMGKPILKYEDIPFKGEKNIRIDDKEFGIHPVSMGNPHCVIFTGENPLDLAQTYGAKIENHPFFPEKTNTEFVKVINKKEIEMCVFERGCGITLACGTGACASVVAGVLNNLTEHKVKVNLLGGAVTVEWSGSKDNIEKDVYLTGPAQYTFFADFIL